MKIIKNDLVDSLLIKELRFIITHETKEVKYFLGINSSNVREMLPIKNRQFDIWVMIIENKTIGVLTFSGREDIKFIKMLYILEPYRSQGYGKVIFNELYKIYPKLECRINDGNLNMYKLMEKVGMRGEKPRMFNFPKNSDYFPIWWSNYQEESSYV